MTKKGERQVKSLRLRHTKRQAHRERAGEWMSDQQTDLDAQADLDRETVRGKQTGKES